MPTITPPIGNPLTRRQQEIYDYLVERIMKGLPPTVREIGSQFGIRSPNGVMCHLKALEKKGLITRDDHLSRAITLVNDPYTILNEQHVALQNKCRELIGSTNWKDAQPIITEIDSLITV